MCLEMEMEGPRQTTHPPVYQELLKVWEADGSDMNSLFLQWLVNMV